jgi:hypothetical protein
LSRLRRTGRRLFPHRKRPTLPDGKRDEFYWHPTLSRFGLRVFANGSGTWLVQYRNGRGQSRKHKLGDAAAITLKQATNFATITFGEIGKGLDPQGAREEARDRPKCTLGAMVERFLDEGVLLLYGISIER